ASGSPERAAPNERSRAIPPGPSEGDPGAARLLTKRDGAERHLGSADGDGDFAVKRASAGGVVVADIERDRLTLLRGALEVDSAFDRARDADPIERRRNARAVTRRTVRVEDVPIR